MSVPFNQHIFPKDQQPLHAGAWISNNIFSSVMCASGSTDILRKNNSYKIIFTRFYFLAPCFLMVVPNQPFIALCRRKRHLQDRWSPVSLPPPAKLIRRKETSGHPDPSRGPVSPHPPLHTFHCLQTTVDFTFPI